MLEQISSVQPDAEPDGIDLICLSHLRWGFVFQRPQHLMSRFARQRRVFFVEEPVFESAEPELRTHVCPQTGVTVVVPSIPDSTDDGETARQLQQLLLRLLGQFQIHAYIAWFYTPMALRFASDLQPAVTVYDCMDELSLFRGAPPALLEYEEQLIRRADLVFTGGLSLFEAKCERHHNIHAFPSSVDVPHFLKARSTNNEPVDQQDIPHPRIGYAGVIDERMDLELLAAMAEMRPDWHLIMLGPVVKIPMESLPGNANIHYLGMKLYETLPSYFSGWDVAMLPFARNESTRYISPTKTPEYLAAGLPVVSTSIRDVVRPYGELGLVRIASDAQDFVRGVDELLTYNSPRLKSRERADVFLATLSWDNTWRGMNKFVLDVMAAKGGSPLNANGKVHALESSVIRGNQCLTI